MIYPLLTSILALTASAASPANTAPVCEKELVILGAGQDAGAPQIGNSNDDGSILLPTSLAMIDRSAGKRYLFEATPAITPQLSLLNTIEPAEQGLGLDGIFLTHAHIGHYLGLAYLGREAAGAQSIPVYTMPRLSAFLRSNGPWDQLVALKNIELKELTGRIPHILPGGVAVTPLSVPHRDEYSETVGFEIANSGGLSALFVPDVDSWSEWENEHGVRLTELVQKVDYAFVDATFYDDSELPGRDMSEIPHPRVTQTMDLLAELSPEDRAKVHFIHYNHTNPIRDPDSMQSKEVERRGYNIARRGQRFCL